MMLDYKKVFADILTGKENKTGHDLLCHCPFHNDKTPSFSISLRADKQVYHCFSCGAKGSYISYYMQRHSLSYNEAMEQLDMNISIPVVQYIKPVLKFPNYGEFCVESLTKFADNYKKHAKDLYNIIGLTATTAMWEIGIDAFGNWVFPIMEHKTKQYVGYELRPHDFSLFQNGSKCKKPTLQDGYTLNCLSLIHSSFFSDKKKCIITEGFKDGYFMLQYLHEKYKTTNITETILTPSCGVNTLPDLLKDNPLKEFEEIIFVLDNDDAGNKVKEQLIGKDSRYKFFSQLQNDEDFENWYKRTKKGK